MKKTIIFDFDGPIVDSFQSAFEVAKMVTPTLTMEKYKNRFLHNIFVATDADTEPKDETIDFTTEFSKKMKQLDLHPEKRDALHQLSENYHFHVVSGTDSATIREYLERHGVLHLFTDILGSDVATSKVVRFNMLFERHGMPTEEVVFITDTVGDLDEAHKVSIGTTIAVCDGYQSREILEAANPTYVVGSLRDVPGLLVS